MVLKSLNFPPALEAPKTTKVASPAKKNGDSMSKTVVNLSDTHYQRVANALALLSGPDRSKAIKRAYELNKTVVQDQGLTLGNLT